MLICEQETNLRALFPCDHYRVFAISTSRSRHLAGYSSKKPDLFGAAFFRLLAYASMDSKILLLI